MKKKIKTILGCVVLLVILVLVVQLLKSCSGAKKEYDYLAFTTVEDLQIQQTGGTYTASASVTIPDLRKYLPEFSASGAVEEKSDWEKVESKVAKALYKFLKKQKNRETVTYEIQLDLAPYLEDYRLSIEYLEMYRDGDPADFAFSEEQVQEFLVREAFHRNLLKLWEE